MFSLCKTFPFAVNEIEPTNRWLVVRVFVISKEC